MESLQTSGIACNEVLRHFPLIGPALDESGRTDKIGVIQVRFSGRSIVNATFVYIFIIYYFHIFQHYSNLCV